MQENRHKQEPSEHTTAPKSKGYTETFMVVLLQDADISLVL